MPAYAIIARATSLSANATSMPPFTSVAAAATTLPSTVASPPNPTTAVGPPVIYRGTLNASHTSTVALVYTTRTLPMPWPFYLASMGLSLLLALWTRYLPRLLGLFEPLHRWVYFTVAHNRWYFPGDAICATSECQEAARAAAWRRLRHWALHAPLVVGSARTLGALVLAARVTLNDDSRRPAPSALMALFATVVPTGMVSVFALGLASLDIVLLAITAGIMLFRGSGRHGIGYGAVVAVTAASGGGSGSGGNGGSGACPLNVPTVRRGMRLVGCGLASLRAADKRRLGEPSFALPQRKKNSDARFYNAFSGGSIKPGEEALAVIFAGLLGLYIVFFATAVVVGLFISVCQSALSFCRRRRRGATTTIRNNGNNNAWTDEALLVSFSSVAAVVIAFYIVCMFPAHYVQQTRRRVTTVFDSVGPVVRSDSAAALNGSSWSDRFRVVRPADRLGFFEVWWRDHGRRWDTLLAFL